MFRPIRLASESIAHLPSAARAIRKRIKLPRRTYIHFDHLPPSVTDVPLCEGVKPETFFFHAAKKIRLRAARFAAIGDVKGTVVLAFGKGGSIEDYQKIANSYARGGYQVFCFDPRGQGFSTHMDADMNKVHVNSPGEHIGDLKKFLKEIVVPRQQGPLLLVGHSMGAAIILVGVGRKFFAADKIILLAPMIKALRAPSGAKAYGVRALCAAHKLAFRGRRYMGKHRPNGIGVSAAWVNAYYVLTLKLLRKLPMIDVPTALVLADKDEAVSGAEAIKLCREKITGFSDDCIHTLQDADHNFNQGFARLPGSAKADAGEKRGLIITITDAMFYDRPSLTHGRSGHRPHTQLAFG